MRTRGLTLVELLVVLAIVAVLTTLAAPSFQRQVQSARISSAVDTFLSDLRFARGEATRRSAMVAVCRSDEPEAKPPTCANGKGKGWTSGWIVYHAGNGNGVIEEGEVLRVQAPLNSIDAIVEDNTEAASTVIRFTPTGRLQNLTFATSLLFGGADYSPDLKKRVCISVGGQARIAPARCG